MEPHPTVADLVSEYNVLKRICLIFVLYTLYRGLNKGLSNRRIRLLLTTVLCILITGVGMSLAGIKYGGRDVIWWFYTISEPWSIYWFVPIVGFAGLDSRRAKERIGLIVQYVRVSSQEQSDKSGKQRQKNSLDKEVEKIDCDEVIYISAEWESARTMLRENIDEIVNIVRNHPDETVGLMIEDVDRLSRAPPFEAAVFLWVLSRFDVIFYFGDIGYFDFSDPNQQLMAFFALYRSRQDYNSIIERTSSGQKSIKMEGGFPGKTPFGYSKIDKKNHELEINKQQAAVIQKAVERILSVENPAVRPIWEDLKDEYATGLEYFPAYGSLLHILRSKKYIGEITHDGEVVGHIPQIISKDDYERVIKKIGTPDNQKNDDLDHVLQSVIHRFGIDGSINLFDIIKGQCPECGGDVKTMGSTERWGNRVLKYKCIGATSNSQEATGNEFESSCEAENAKADQDDDETTKKGCEFNGPLLSRSFLQKWERGLPIVCPQCQTPADEDDWKRSDTKINAVEQTCDECGLWYSADVDIEYDSPVHRGMDFPKHAIRIFDDTGDGSDNKKSNDESENSKETNSDSDQQKIGSF